MWYKNIASRFFGVVTEHACDRQTDGQNYDSQDCASTAVSRGNNKHLGTVSVHFTRASDFMINNGSEFAVLLYTKIAQITQTQQINMHILHQVQVNLIYNTNRNLFLWTEIFISTTDLHNTTADRWSCHLPNRNKKLHLLGGCRRERFLKGGGRLRGNVRTSSIARWKARVRLPVRHN